MVYSKNLLLVFSFIIISNNHLVANDNDPNQELVNPCNSKDFEKSYNPCDDKPYDRVLVETTMKCDQPGCKENTIRTFWWEVPEGFPNESFIKQGQASVEHMYRFKSPAQYKFNLVKNYKVGPGHVLFVKRIGCFIKDCLKRVPK